MDPLATQTLLFLFNRFHFGVKGLPASIIHQPDFTACGGKTHIRIIFAQQQAVFGPAGKHAVRFFGPHGRQIVNQYAHVGLIATQDERIFLLYLQGRVGTGYETLGTGFFVTGRTVNLAGKEQTINILGFEGLFQVAGIEEVILNGITRANNMRVFKAFDGMDQRLLNIKGQAG